MAGALLVVPRALPHLDLFYRNAYFHLVVVSGIASCALVVALVASRIGTRAAHYGPVWLAVGCLAVGFLMVAHGLTTPGVGSRPVNTWVGRLPYLAISCFAVGLALAGRARNTRTSRLAVEHPKALIGGVMVVLAVGTAWVVADPTRLAGTKPIAN